MGHSAAEPARRSQAKQSTKSLQDLSEEIEICPSSRDSISRLVRFQMGELVMINALSTLKPEGVRKSASAARVKLR
jgi:hypothetical protein